MQYASHDRLTNARRRLVGRAPASIQKTACSLFALSSTRPIFTGMKDSNSYLQQQDGPEDFLFSGHRTEGLAVSAPFTIGRDAL